MTRRIIVVLIAVGLLCGSASAAKVTFGPRHEMRVDGKLFLPVHAWAASMADLDRLKAMGVNLVLGLADGSMSWKPISEETIATTKTYLDELHKRQMYGMILISSWWGDAEKRGSYKDKPLAAYMAHFKDHPALLGWQVSSEEDMGLGRGKRKELGLEGWAAKPNASAEDIRKRCEEVKKIDPDHPVEVMYSGAQMLAEMRKFTWTTPTPAAFYAETSKSADILYHDLFPVANNLAEDLKQIADATVLLRGIGQGRKHLWVAVDAGDRKRWSTKSHAPTGHEIRNELWQALVEGAHGLGFDFTSWKPTWASIRMSEEGEKGLTAALKEIEGLKEVILLGEVPTGGRVETPGKGEIRTALRRWKGKLYVFAVNVQPAADQATITVPDAKDAPAVVLGEDRTVPLKGGKIVDAFEAYAVHLYVIEP